MQEFTYMSSYRYAAALFGITALLALPAAANAQRDRAESPRRGWIGVRPSFNFTIVNGQRSERVIVIDVVEDSPADRAGVRPGDRIVRINGRDASPASLSDLSRDLNPGDTVRLRLADGGRERDVTVIAAEQPRDIVAATRLRIAPRDSVITKARIFMDSAMRVLMDTAIVLRLQRLDPHEFVFPIDSFSLRMLREPGRFGDGEARIFQFRTDGTFEFPDIEFLGSRSVSGAEFAELNPGLSSYFGTSEGLLVLKVSPGTPADRSGLEPGDVVTHANGQEIRTINDLRIQVMRARGEPVRMEIIRKGKKRTLNEP